MNKVFKTKWSSIRQQYVVTDEHHAAKGKASKSAVALAVASILMIGAGAASAAYLPGYMTPDLQSNLSKALPSIETAEYQKDWGLAAMNSSTAYALGFSGQGVAVGVMDSGALLQTHPDLAGDRFHAVKVPGLAYGSTGERYPQSTTAKGEYSPDSAVPESGQWQKGMNDSHGTHVTGTVGGNRDGSEFHGVAYDADVYVGNTGGTDSTNYGPFQDPQFFHQSWSALATAIADANKFADGTDRGGFINNSFGTNIRVDKGKNVKTYGADGGNTSVHFPTDTTAQTEYEYFLFMKDAANRKNADSKYNGWSFVDSAYEAVKDRNVVQVFTTGNRDFANPFYRPLYPYFNPDAEKNWIAVAGMKQGADNTYELYATFNEAGNAKWWTVAAPGSGIYSSKVDADGNPYWGNSSGTSMAAPHVTGALAVLMSRYDQMDALQVRDVMLTTANHKNADGSNFKGWTAAEGEVDVRYGWGMPDLAKGMFGPGQLLGEFAYNMRDAKSLDVWSNDISETALNQRQKEDQAWLEAAQKWMNNHDAKLTAEELALIGDMQLSSPDKILGIEDSTISKEDAIKWREEYFKKRLDAITARAYDGSLVKSGAGTLVMTGDNSYEGTTTVNGGTLLAFAESIGDDAVTVNDGGTFGVLSSYYDSFTQKGHLDSKEADAGKLTITVRQGGTLYVDAASNVTVKKVELDADSKISVGLAGADSDVLVSAYHGGEQQITGKLTSTEGTDVFKDKTQKGVATDSAFFDVLTAEGSGNTFSVSMAKKDGVNFSSFARTRNERAIAEALEGTKNAFAGDVLAMTKDQISATYAGLSDDMYATARNAFVVNAQQVSRTVIEQSHGVGQGRAAEFADGQGRLWATGMGLWGDAKGESNDLDVDFRVGMIGGEFLPCENAKVGVFFGYGSTDYQGSFGKIDGDDLHYGAYVLSDIGPVSVTAGVAYTTEDRDSTHQLNGIYNTHSEDASVLQGFAEAAYNLDLGAAKVAPYVGFTWAHVKTDGFTEQGGAHQFAVKDQKDDIQISTLGVRTALPFNWGTLPVAVKADLGWSHFYGDTESVTKMQLGTNGGWATLTGKELKDQFNLGLGIVGQVAKNATVGVSYTGAWGSDTDTHGIIGSFRLAF